MYKMKSPEETPFAFKMKNNNIINIYTCHTNESTEDAGTSVVLLPEIGNL